MAFRVLRTYHQRTSELPSVKLFPKKYRPILTKLRNSRKSLDSATEAVRDSVARIWDLLGPDEKQLLHDSRRLLEELAARLQDKDRTLVSSFHPDTRLKSDKPGKWEILIKDYAYELDSLNVAAPAHAVWEELESLLLTEFPDLAGKARYAIIAHLVAAGGLGWAEPTTIKKHLAIRSSKNKVAEF